MDVIEAISVRHSVREFSSKHVQKDTVMKIMEAALMSPSGGNGQPWEVFIASGASVERIRKEYQDRAKSISGSPATPPQPPPRQFQERMTVIRRERFRLLGLDPDDPASDKVFKEWAAKLFGAPVVAIVCADKALTYTRNLDLGLFVQTVCLAAKGCGVDSFIAGQLIAHQDVLRAELEIPDNFNIAVGIALGYPDENSIINTYRSPRRSINEVVRYKS